MTKNVYHLVVTFDVPALDYDHAVRMLKDGLKQWEQIDQIPEYRIHEVFSTSTLSETDVL